MRWPLLILLVTACLLSGCKRGKKLVTKQPHEKHLIWPAKPPGRVSTKREPTDLAKGSDELIAGRPIIRMGHVSTPEIHVFFPPEKNRSRTAVVVCPGGGFNILAWDLEGTEVAEWLNSIGITAVVLKYRVPTRNHKPAWQAGIQDAQRTLGIVRASAERWNLDRDKIGILGFSAGGCIAARTSCATQRLYESVDEIDHNYSCLPNFAILIYPDLLANEGRNDLRKGLEVNAETPPTFLVHAVDDYVLVKHSKVYHSELRDTGVESELYVQETGGHGFGLRPDDSKPITDWPQKCKDWLVKNLWITDNNSP